MENFYEYEQAFKQGLNAILLGDSSDRIEPLLDLGDFKSIGYHDGYHYGKYCEIVGLSMCISNEQLMATIDKYHTQALKRNSEYEYSYTFYHRGFIDGKNSFTEKITNDDASFQELPSINDNSDWISLGYYDSYSYFLNKYLEEGEKYLENSSPLGVIARSYFMEKYREKKLENTENKSK